jgi:hypothetical protein
MPVYPAGLRSPVVHRSPMMLFLMTGKPVYPVAVRFHAAHLTP